MFTPSGSLLATGTSPTAPDAKKSRTYSALAANIWSAYERVAVQGVIEQSLPTASLQPDEPHPAPAPPESAATEPVPTPTPNPGAGLKSLTLELSDYNLHIQLVAPRVLLCLIGPKQPTRHTSSSSSLHSQEDKDKDKDRDRDRDRDNNKSTPPGSAPRTAVASVASAQGAMGSLGILKTQAQALVDYLEKELRGFELPDGI